MVLIHFFVRPLPLFWAIIIEYEVYLLRYKEYSVKYMLGRLMAHADIDDSLLSIIYHMSWPIENRIPEEGDCFLFLHLGMEKFLCECPRISRKVIMICITELISEHVSSRFPEEVHASGMYGFQKCFRVGDHKHDTGVWWAVFEDLQEGIHSLRSTSIDRSQHIDVFPAIWYETQIAYALPNGCNIEQFLILGNLIEVDILHLSSSAFIKRSDMIPGDERQYLYAANLINDNRRYSIRILEWFYEFFVVRRHIICLNKPSLYTYF